MIFLKGRIRAPLMTAAAVVFYLWAFGASAQLSEASSECLDCHSLATPGIVSDWKGGVHSSTAVGKALQKSGKALKVSSVEIPEAVKGFVVGCAECHMSRKPSPDSFEHNGRQVKLVPTPEDCAVCHAAERDQFGQNLMSHAYGNLMSNKLYAELIDSINGLMEYSGGALKGAAATMEANADSCLGCHGTRLKVTGMAERETDYGDFTFPTLEGWPNQGVGRVNPDSSLGACTACHPRHGFSMKLARTPYACAKCHTGPDVPAAKVYSVSVHGSIYYASGDKWDLEAVPWTAGEDFKAPTCAACHVSLVVDAEGETAAERTHRMNDRLPWRIFGLPYAHPHPKSPDTSVISVAQGEGKLPLPTNLTGERATEFLIDAKEMEARKNNMLRACRACHSQDWVDGYYGRFEKTIEYSNAMTRTAADLLYKGWETGAAKGPAQGNGIFNDTLEIKWVKQWLFYANSTRFASAMMGADYGVFADGRWKLSSNLREMEDEIAIKEALNNIYGPFPAPGKTEENKKTNRE